jgi:phosphoribosyl 1,2-cyclic phosphate phosphodiesterase
MPEREKMKFTILGSGTSSGIPTIGCKCPVCTSTDPKDKRLRTSLLVESETTTIVVDTSTDFRQQMLTNNVDKLDAVLFTHHHFDHIGGFDDIRAYNYQSRKPMQIYLTEECHKRLRETFIYAFEIPEQIGGGVPMIDVNLISTEKFTIGDIEIQPIRLMHGNMEILGFRFGDFAYCTDTNFVPEESIELLKGVDVLILDALRYQKHSTHFTISEAIEVSREIGARRTYFTHMTHQILHADCDPQLPDGINLSYDGLVIEL